MSPLVSIMTPCYNGEKFVGRYLDSVLAQTYDNIEVVIVDDGSTDNTAAVIKSYIPKFDAKGYKLVYVYQENGGLGSTYNAMMSKLKGDFISWCDSDDFFTPDSFEKRVNFLQQNPQYDFCMCQMYEVDEDNLKVIKNIMRRIPPSTQDNLFIDLLTQKNVVFTNIWLVRRDIFFKAHPTKKIFPSRQGQNWQLLLPLAYRYNYGYVNEPLIYYVVSDNSMSHAPRTFKQEVERNLGFIVLLTATIKQLNAPNETELLNYVWAKFMHKNLMLAINNVDANLIYDCCRQAHERNLNIFGDDNFDVAFLLAKYILPRIELQNKLDSVRKDISKLNDKLKI